jgi:hypothetical protein
MIARLFDALLWALSIAMFAAMVYAPALWRLAGGE